MRRCVVLGLVSLCVSLCVCVVGASGASALEFGGNGAGAGQFKEPNGVAVDHLTGDVYVVDTNLRRVNEFEANGTFVRAWGWGVNVTAPEAKLQECTTASGCQAGELGGGAGELNKPAGIAVSSELGKEAVYVLEGGNDRVQEFTPEGQFVRMWGGKVNKAGGNVCASGEAAECQAGSEGAGDGEFTSPGRQGAIAVGPTGSVYVGDLGRVQRFSSEGVWESSFDTAVDNTVQAVVVTSADKICVAINNLTVAPSRTLERTIPEVFCYPSGGGAPEHTLVLPERPFSETATVRTYLAADGSGHLFVDEYVTENTSNEKEDQVITKYAANFAQTGLFAPPGRTSANQYVPTGMALQEVSKAASEVLVATRTDAVVYGGPPPLPGPAILSQEATPEPGGTVTFAASVNPIGERTKYHVDYGTEVAHEAATATETMVAEGTTPETVEVRVSGLTPFVTYHFHFVAENGEGVVPGQDGTFVAVPAVGIDSLSVGDVTSDSATLEALLNPHGADTHFYFEYAPSGSDDYERTPQAGAGAGVTDTPVSAHIQGLAADTIYTYRVVAVNRFSEEHPEAVQQVEPRQLTTQRAGVPFALLDGRAWEQVSPSAKANASVATRSAAGNGPLLSTPDGEALTYVTAGSPEVQPEGEVLSAQVLSRHGADGWSSQDITAPFLHRANNKVGEAGYYWLFSEDLERSVIEPSPYTPLSEWTSERTPYLREEAKCVVSPPLAAGSECFVPLLTNKSGPFDDVTEPGVEFGGPLGSQIGYVTLRGATPDLSRLVVKSEATGPLVKGGGSPGLYEWSQGTLAPVSVLPVRPGHPTEEPLEGCSTVELGQPETNTSGNPFNARNAISPDGSLVVWSDSYAGACEGHLYIRNMQTEKTTQVDEVEAGVSVVGVSKPRYQDASVGDEHIFFTDSQPLTANSTSTQGAGSESEFKEDLYEYDRAPGNAPGRVVDMTTTLAHAGEAADVQGVVGASEDGAYVYFVANGVLSSNENAHKETAQPGDCLHEVYAVASNLCNLYVAHRDGSGWERPVFIARLSETDAGDWGDRESDGLRWHAAFETARVSPDGKWLAFMSQRSLTGYDNEDVTSEHPGERLDEEVFLYGLNSDRTICASCDPTGARPTGVLREEGANAEPLFDRERAWLGRWIAGVVPSPYAVGIGGQLGLGQPRYLSNGGRLFFDSTDGLVAADSNRQVDAYEYEPPANGEVAGSDDCTTAAATYAPAAEGCIDLLSSGTSNEESVFLEASENGDSAFILTAAPLVKQDTDTAYDIYDAHVCGSGWECPAASAVSPPCTGAESCRAAPAAQPSIYSSPSSSTFSGPGNAPAITQTPGTTTVKKTVKKTVKCVKGKRRVRGKCVKAKPKEKKKKAKSSGRSMVAGKAGTTRRGK